MKKLLLISALFVSCAKPNFDAPMPLKVKVSGAVVGVEARVAQVGMPWRGQVMFLGTLPSEPVAVIIKVDGEPVRVSVGHLIQRHHLFQINYSIQWYYQRRPPRSAYRDPYEMESILPGGFQTADDDDDVKSTIWVEVYDVVFDEAGNPKGLGKMYARGRHNLKVECMQCMTDGV